MKKTITLFSFSLFTLWSFAQSIDTTQTPSFFRGQITATNNGISLIPNFSLNKPAALFDLSIGKGRLSFDPMLRFGLDGKPWTLIFWFRYKVVDQRKFTLGIGAHPALLFRTETAFIAGISKEVLTTQRYVAWEASPTYRLNKNVALGLYYIGSHGLTRDLIQLTNFVAARVLFTNLKLGSQFNYAFSPQVYYLQQDKLDGTYWNASFGLAKNHFPLTISANLSQKIQSEIPGKDFLWSLGLVYNINNTYFKTSTLSRL
ncbi:hypothetical protein [Haliscomenobacter hydrossis]|uniref:Outer membrane protein beta-barrel domain-containing protein n=1 Tax=Haliscomenobacter hydrossis (strain ATCC 27775 / DSM 1100 / LMG 10767 / O) TaxID=760192 RepID=F4L2W5_HALH1|nr:hypothetical protein [Haliscomenobacter hydrossis]AEE49645.1 hypothetical protein Halhy_1757 [Haliscomenobacter hydrossis DSM 1100]